MRFGLLSLLRGSEVQIGVVILCSDFQSQAEFGGKRTAGPGLPGGSSVGEFKRVVVSWSEGVT